jgi:hypothetical protein
MAPSIKGTRKETRSESLAASCHAELLGRSRADREQVTIETNSGVCESHVYSRGGPAMKGIKTFSAVAYWFGVSCSLTNLAEAQAASPVPLGKPLICVVPPDIQLGQGAVSAADPGGPVVSSLVSYLSGPVADVQLLQARIPVQFNAEAVQKGCAFVVQSSVVQKKAGKGMSGLLAAAPALMNVVPFIGSASGGADVYAATQLAGAAVEGVAAVQAQDAQGDPALAMSGVAQTNIKKGDQITLTYRLTRTGSSAPAIDTELKSKAQEAGQDILSPLLVQMATDVLSIALMPAG